VIGLEPRSFDGGATALARLAVSHPRAAYLLATLLGTLRHRLTHRWPALAEVLALFPALSIREAKKIGDRIAALHERNRVLVHSIRRYGIEATRPLVLASESFTTITGPRIIGTFHTGALHAIGPALERLPSPVLALRNGVLFKPDASLEVQSTKGNEQQRAAALHRALVHLRNGGVVMLALDDAQDQAVEAPCLGRTLRLAPGAFALSRWTGAPIVPAVARWTSNGIRVDAGEALRTPEEAAAWLERYLLASPSELTLGLLRSLLAIS
jgi:hypothetical protein